MDNDDRITNEQERQGESRLADDTRDHPDRRPPRGNPEVEEIDVERGKGKIERVLGW